MIVAFDVETHLIAPGAVTPRLVCASFHDGEETQVLSTKDDLRDALETILRSADMIVAHGGKFDFNVVAKFYPSLVPLIFRAYDECRIADTKILEQLHDLATLGEIEGRGYTLADLAERRLGVKLDALKEGDEIWRTRFGELEGLSAKDYPEGARLYSELDAELTYQIFKQQTYYPVQSLHTAAAFCCYRMTSRGMKVDKALKDRLQKKVLQEMSPEALPLIFACGLVIAAQPPAPYANGAKAHHEGCPRKDCDCPVKMKAATEEQVAQNAVLRPLVKETFESHGMSVPLTDPSDRFPEGQISTDVETLEVIAPFNQVIGDFLKFASNRKLKTSYFPALEWPYGSGITADQIHFDFEDLKKTGRVSGRGTTQRNYKRAFYPAMNVQQADPRIREIYMPDEGWVLACADYNAIDLCALAQTIFRLFGHSTLRDQINAGQDPHCVTGAILLTDAGEGWSGGHDEFKALKESDPKRFKHWRTLAKTVGLGYPGGMGLQTMVNVCAAAGFKITKADAKHYKRLWLRVYPEMHDYLNHYVPSLADSRGWHTYTSSMGYRRARCNFTEAANGLALQTPAAEGMKIAHFKLERACSDPTLGDVMFGCAPLITIHDEFVVAVPKNRQMGARARRLGEIMVEGMREVLPDVNVRAVPLLTRRWVKEAEQVLDKNGNIVLWEKK